MRHTTTFDVRQFTKEINEYDIKTRDGIHALESHIRKYWMISEIIWFHPFLHGGTFQSPAGWGYEQSGVVTETREEDTALARLFDGLLFDCHTNMGAAAILRMHNSRFLSGYAITNGGNGPHVYELTLDELAAEIPDEYKKKLDLIQAVTLAARTAGASAKAAVEHTLPKVYTRIANMSDNELRDAAKPKRRRKGGGRKQVRDIGNRQVKAVIALSPASHRRPIMECCAEVIRKGGDFENPYKTSKDLAAAVRRFGNRTGKPITFRTQSRAWSEKS